MQLPKGYCGVVARKMKTSQTQAQMAGKMMQMQREVGAEIEDEEEEEEGESVETREMEVEGTFEKVVVWGHEAVPEDEDVYVKGMEEWIGFAEGVSSDA